MVMNVRTAASIIKSQLASTGLRARINAKCVDCGYDPMDAGNWRMQIEACLVTDCPLYPVRPLTMATTAAQATQTPAQAAASKINGALLHQK